MNYNLSHVTTNPMVLCSAVLASIGWLVTFIAACVTRLHGASWWIIVYELGLIIVIYVVLTKSLFAQYQLTLLVLLAISIAMLTQLIEMFINRTDQASQAGAAGSCILVIMQYVWVFIFGSSEESAIHRSIYGLHNTSAPMVTQAQFSSDSHRTGSLRSMGTASSYRRQNNNHNGYPLEKQQQPSKQSAVSSTNPPAFTSDGPLVVNNQNAASASIITTESDAMPAPELKKNEAKALHAYRANAEDPNELSFEKNEILEIIDKRGNWWQAKKKDGSLGIVPSNYFAA
ncbi:hypothetical protein BDB00DRAFT_798464 [Zychaea mexicana]|uniref:uncharacterized protein n=1 Tax=Zychaea mexicana TaxID=64656 RepID=UPI0022FDDF2B|nr:uncharacterized protein BDB00DRAFT_798464 [Zychaea mexicana]KAI9498554.1 hypothetical protein BDB00DRAFT_798464 [Zychaea mexicana]